MNDLKYIVPLLYPTVVQAIHADLHTLRTVNIGIQGCDSIQTGVRVPTL